MSTHKMAKTKTGMGFVVVNDYVHWYIFTPQNVELMIYRPDESYDEGEVEIRDHGGDPERTLQKMLTEAAI